MAVDILLDVRHAAEVLQRLGMGTQPTFSSTTLGGDELYKKQSSRRARLLETH